MQKKGNGIHPVLSAPWTSSEKAADRLTAFIGSWRFIFIFWIYVFFWIGANIFAWIENWDPYPFILLNLTLSILAAIQAPIILMAQNRQNQKDRIRSEYDYAINRKAEHQIERLQEQLDRIEKGIKKR